MTPARRETRRSRPHGAAREQEPPANGELPSKYKELCVKYERVVERYAALVQERGTSTALALVALRASTSAIALFRETTVTAQNAPWDGLAKLRGDWRALAPGDSSASWSSFQELVLESVRDLLGPRRRRRERSGRYEHLRTGRVIELRAERAGREPVVAVFAHDVTERVLGERELEAMRNAAFEQQRMRAIGELASGVAHDLNNALHAMAMRLALLRKVAADEQQAHGLDALERIVADAAVRIGRLQEFARHRQDAPHSSVDLAAIARDAVSLAQPDLGRGSEPDHGPIQVENAIRALPQVAGVAAELRHVFVNLLLNARDAMPGGGTIRLDARVDDGDVLVTVADEGVGIPAENLTRVFEPFFTTKDEKGTGLGLAVAYGVMRRLGGTIAAASGEAGGAVFTLRFPVASPAERPEPVAAGPVVPGQRVLVVDDDEDNLEAMRLVLEHLSQQVTTARSGDEALARFSAGERFDLVLCDVGMPKMSGWQAVREIRARAPEARIHMLTGWAREIAPDAPVRQLVEGVLSKPLDVAQLERILATPR